MDSNPVPMGSLGGNSNLVFAMDPRLRGGDIVEFRGPYSKAVIPAKAGIHEFFHIAQMGEAGAGRARVTPPG